MNVQDLCRFTRLATPGDIQFLLQEFKPRDIERHEVEEISKLPFQEALRQSLMYSKAYVIDLDGTIEGVFGINDYDPGVGIPWLLVSDRVLQEHPRTFARYSRRILNRLSKPYHLLFNYVFKENEAAVQWLRFLGFQFFDNQFYFSDFGPPCLLFYKEL